MAITRERFLLSSGALAATATIVGSQVDIASAQGSEIPVGILVPLTGGGAPYGTNMLKSAQITADLVNKAGPPLGRPFKLYTADDQTSPDPAVAAAQKLMSLNHVVAILGTWSSAVTLAVIPLTLQAGIIEMNTSGAPDVTSPKYRKLVFRTQPTDKPYGVSMARYAKSKNYAKVAALVLNNPFALAVRDSFMDEWNRMHMPAPSVVVYNPGASSYAGEVQKALADKPDLLIVAGYTPDASIIIKEWYASDVKTHLIGPGFAFNDALVKNVGVAAANGLLAVDGVPPVGTPGFKAFAPVYHTATGAELADPLSFWPAQIHDQVNILALAIEAAKSTKGEDIAAKVREVSAPSGTEVYDYANGVKLLRQGKKINYQGASGPCDFDESHNIVTDFAVWEISGGKRTQVATFTAKELGSAAS